MAQNFIIAFGGSGARCAEALAYLYAARCIPQGAHILMIDPDESNGNVVTARDQLQRHWRIHQCIRSDPKAFFAPPLNQEATAGSFFWQYPNAHQPFQNLINYAAHQTPHQGLLQLLYDQDDFALSFEQGYVGRAHIGSLDLLRTLKRGLQESNEDQNDDRNPLQVFIRLLREAVQRPEGATLLVYGSIFGGTGASGLPAVPPLLREYLPEGLFQKLRIGCVQLTPYFTFPPGESQDPDSALHPLATQAALYHYSYSQVGYHRIYLVGAPDRISTNEDNQRGGALQRNRAHYAELGAALAAAHFFDQFPSSTDHVEVFACGSKEVGWRSLPHHEATRIKQNFTAFATFCLLHAHFLYEDLTNRRHLDTKWLRDLERGTGRQTLGGQERELVDLHKFALRFLDWVREIEAVEDVDLFTIPDKPTVETLGSVLPQKSREVDAYHELLRRLNKGLPVKQDTAPGWYISALTLTVDDFTSQHYQFA